MNHQAESPGELPSESDALTWRRLLGGAGVLAAGAMAVVSVVITDVEAAVVAVGFAVATWLNRGRKRRLGAVGIALASAITLFFMSTAAVTNIRAGSALTAVLISSGLAAVALLGLVAALGYLLQGSSSSTAGPRAALIASAIVLVGLVAWGTASSRPDGKTGDIHMVTENVAFSETELNVPAGEITVVVENEDLFWHTFTIPELDVDLRVPVGAELSLTFAAPPGDYEFVCDIPGHTEAGMRGTLIVEP